MGGVSGQTLNCSHLFGSAEPLANIPLNNYFQVLSQADYLSYFMKGKASTHIFLVFFKIIEAKQTFLKSCYSEDSRR